MDLINNNDMRNDEAGPSTSKSDQLTANDIIKANEMATNEIIKTVDDLDLEQKLMLQSGQVTSDDMLKMFQKTQKVLNEVLAFKSDLQKKVEDITATINSIEPIPDFEGIMSLVNMKDSKSTARK